MKKRYKRKAYYLDDGVLIYGFKDKRGFHPNSDISCGFSLQVLNKKSIGKTLFFSLKEAFDAISEIQLAGVPFYFCIDDGLAITKVICRSDDFVYYFTTSTLIHETVLEDIIGECFHHIGIKKAYDFVVYYAFSNDVVNKLSGDSSINWSIASYKKFESEGN